jgi:hypothetical protein
MRLLASELLHLSHKAAGVKRHVRSGLTAPASLQVEQEFFPPQPAAVAA